MVPLVTALANADPALATAVWWTPPLTAASAKALVPVAFAAALTATVPLLLNTAEALPPTIAVDVGRPRAVPVTTASVPAAAICRTPSPMTAIAVAEPDETALALAPTEIVPLLVSEAVAFPTTAPVVTVCTCGMVAPSAVVVCVTNVSVAVATGLPMAA